MLRTRLHRRLAGLALLGAGLLPSACQSTSGSGEDSVPLLVARGRYQEATVLAARLRDERPDDPERIEQHRLATTALLMYQGRTAFFDDRIADAHEAFERAGELSPEVPQVSDWILKVDNRLADDWISKARRMYIDGELEGARDAYEHALAYRPFDHLAREGLGKVLLQLNYRQGLGEDYYGQGLRDLADYWLYEARSGFEKSGKYLGKDFGKVVRRAEQTNELLAGTCVTRALDLERKGLFAAARNEFRLVLTLEPENAEALEGLERMTVEALAAEKLSEAEMLTLRRRYAEAREVLAQGQALTRLQGEAFEGALAEIESARLNDMYVTARELESDYDYPEAIEAYDRLLGEAGYYEDAITRRDVLGDIVVKAEELYGAAQAETDPAEKLSLLRQIQFIWPEFRDSVELIEELEKLE